MTAYRLGQSARPGTSYPLGATVRADGTNFAVTSSAADSMQLCLFDAAAAARPVSRWWTTTRVFGMRSFRASA